MQDRAVALHLSCIAVARRLAGRDAVKLGVLEPLPAVDFAERHVLIVTLRPRCPLLTDARRYQPTHPATGTGRPEPRHIEMSSRPSTALELSYQRSASEAT